MEGSNVARIESGRTNVTVSTLCRLCTVMKINIGDLFANL